VRELDVIDAAGRRIKIYVDLKVGDKVGFGKVVKVSEERVELECMRCHHFYERAKSRLGSGVGGKVPLGYCGQDECLPSIWYRMLRSVHIGMVSRCHNPKSKDFTRYGGRGLEVCEEWRFDVYSFIAFALDNGWKPGLQIDREENSEGYTPENCRFVTNKVNSRNTRSNRLITLHGKTQTRAEWAEEYDVDYFLLRGRLKKGWTIEQALTKPIQKQTRDKQPPTPKPRPRITKTSTPSPQDNPSASRPRLRTQRPRLSDHE
jgi:hypothetical protein